MTIPNIQWIDNIIEITKDTTINIIKGSSAYSANVFKGQKFKVVGRQEGNWLQLVSLDNLKFELQAGIQSPEYDRGSSHDFYGNKFGQQFQSSGIIFGISLSTNRDKFKVIKG